MSASEAKATNSILSQNPKESEYTIKSSLDASFVTITNQQDFSRLLKNSGNRLLVVEFFAKWCGPCQILATKLQELAKSYDGRLLIVKVDVDECEALTSEFNILAIPTFIILKNKKKLRQFFSSDIQTLEKNLEKYVGKPFKSKKKIKVVKKM